MMPVLAGVLGFPVAHSRSPAIHNAAYRALDLDWRYLKLPVRPEDFAEALRALPGSGYRGANVTIPHKVAALRLADETTPAAAAIGAANSLRFSNGSIEGDNTDAGGFLDALGPARVAGLPDLRALVLGAGGAGRAVAWALREAGAREVSIWNRTSERARLLAEELGVRHAARPQSTDLLVNATSVELDSDSSRGDAEIFEALQLDRRVPPSVLVDLVYGESVTTLCRWAQENGSEVVDGLEVLVRQGMRSFERWTGLPAPLEVMRAAAAKR